MLGHNIDFQPQQITQIHQQAPHVEQRAARLHINEEVHIAVGSSLATSHRTKNPNVARSVFGGDFEDLFLFFKNSARIHYSTFSMAAILSLCVLTRYRENLPVFFRFPFFDFFSMATPRSYESHRIALDGFPES
jgi:hypothetical protein